MVHEWNCGKGTGECPESDSPVLSMEFFFSKGVKKIFKGGNKVTMLNMTEISL